MKIVDFLNNNKCIRGDLFNVGFDDIFTNVLDLTSHVCESLFSQVNIIGQVKHWRKTDSGLCAEPCDSTKALSELVSNEKQFFEVVDIFEDNRIIDKQLIINDLIIRYYAAIPLILSDGSTIGTISIMDCKPHKLSNGKQLLLSLLAKNVVSQIELYLKNYELEKKALHQGVVVDSTPGLVYSIENLYRDLDEFSHRAAHDLKGPLNAIKNITSWIEEDIESGNTEDNSKYFSMVKNSVNRMYDLLAGLQAYSKIGREISPAECINLKSIVLDNCQSISKAENFDIKVESFEMELPKTPLLFVLNHLLSNAIKHHDKATGIIDICCVSELNYYQLTITDDGPGIPIAFQSEIFNVFQKLKSKDEVEGSGLGLAMVRKTLTPYSAEISINSQVNIGTTFTVIWPK